LSNHVPLPNEGTAAEFAGIYYVLSKAFALDLYNLVNDTIVSKTGDTNWFGKINADREEKGLFKYLDPKDPRFLLDQANYHHSILRLVIPGIDVAWDTAAAKLKKLLNNWSHHQVEPKPTTFLELLYPMSVIARQSKLGLDETMGKLIERTKQIRDMVWVPEGPAAELPQEAEIYAEEVEQKIQEIKRRPPVGSPWIGEPGQRRVKLSKALHDITENGVSIKSELSPDPEIKVAEFLRYYPNGGDLRIDDDGAVLGYIKGDPFLVGWLGEEPGVKPEEIRGFIDSRDYIFLGNDLKDSVTNELLSEVAEEPIDILINGINAWGGLEIGSVINVTEYGDLVFITEQGETKRITKVHKGIWFIGSAKHSNI
jgi:hypothetical protein